MCVDVGMYVYVCECVTVCVSLNLFMTDPGKTAGQNVDVGEQSVARKIRIANVCGKNFSTYVCESVPVCVCVMV